MDAPFRMKKVIIFHSKAIPQTSPWFPNVPTVLWSKQEGYIVGITSNFSDPRRVEDKVPDFSFSFEMEIFFFFDRLLLEMESMAEEWDRKLKALEVLIREKTCQNMRTLFLLLSQTCSFHMNAPSHKSQYGVGDGGGTRARQYFNRSHHLKFACTMANNRNEKLKLGP